ncbi:hypothetical protein V5O48_005200 [Marasmius crinis-equi]|uniref:F-box domain-containing protein n=1 Tax=Marasmius crinis-equi TaxID=585013 RepID=A0ABR3FN13_9AGAR
MSSSVLRSDARVSPHHIPPELQEIIIDKLLEDKGSVFQASLVCKHWRLRGYRTAFAAITLSPKTIHTFSSFLESPFSRTSIFTSVRHISIFGPTISWTPETSKSAMSILSFVANLRSVSSLTLRSMEWDIFGPQVEAVVSAMQSIRSLEIVDVLFANSAQISELVGRFGSLGQLNFQDTRFLSSLGWDPSVYPHFQISPDNSGYGGKCVGSLSLRCYGTVLQKALKWAGALPVDALPTLTHFGARTCAGSDASGLLRSLGPLLNTLELRSTADVFCDSILRSLDISQNASLSEVKFISPDRVLGTISWLPDLLQSVPPSIRSIEIAFASSRQFALDLPVLYHISSILDAPRFHNLQIVYFNVCNTSRPDPDLNQTIKEQILSAFSRSEWLKIPDNTLHVSFTD